MTDPSPITPDLVAGHGLTPDEYRTLLEILGREPTLAELGVFSVMWSEHCSYKSSKRWLKTLPTEAPHVIQGPGENAGVIDIGDGLACVFKIESHNHPSFIEPYQGAATGVGGIMRDVFTMGARPIANLNALRFGDPAHPKSRHLVSGVVAGIAGYGNCMGVPTVGGECDFDSAYNGNILVNAMTVGIAPADRIFYSAAAGPGNPVVYVGSKTGRDGIHGATMASAPFEDDSEEKRPTVQVGDPFTEKLLLEACLELMATDAIVAIQDMGAAGLTSSSVEMSSKGGVGIELDLDLVPTRETGMTAYEILLSESQERMLMVLKPGREDEARAIFGKWELDFAVIGRITDSGRFVARMGGEPAADIPVDPLVGEAPEYDRAWKATPPARSVDPEDCPPPCSPEDALLTLLASPDQASKRWIWEQYDHLVMGRTRIRPGGNAAVVGLPGSNRALALTTDCTPRYCRRRPGRGRAAGGRRGLAQPDGGRRDAAGDDEQPEFRGPDAAGDHGTACRLRDRHGRGLPGARLPGRLRQRLALQRDRRAGDPADPGGRRRRRAGGRRPTAVDRGTVAPDHAIVLIGDTAGHLGASVYLRDLLGRTDGAPPPVDLAAERRNGDLVRRLIGSGVVLSCHDLSDGGLALALAEMALAGRAGLALNEPPAGLPLHAWLFGEDQGRYLVESEDAGTILEAAQAAGVPASVIGETVAAPSLTLREGCPISLARLREAHEGWLPGWIGGSQSGTAAARS